jgi:hypothetical protein
VHIDQPHSWSHTPDVAEGLFQLGLHPEMAGHTLHLPVPPPLSGRTMLSALAAVLGTELVVRRMPKAMLRMMGWINPMMRELPEMQYQFENPFVTWNPLVISDARIRNLLPIGPTPLKDQMPATAHSMTAGSISDAAEASTSMRQATKSTQGL